MIPKRPRTKGQQIIQRNLNHCRKGYHKSGDGQECTDMDECVMGRHACHPSTLCVNIEGSYYCTCPQGMQFTGFDCEDVNECTHGSHKCDQNASCSNFEKTGKEYARFAGYTCKCNSGFVGNGYMCISEQADKTEKIIEVNETKLGSLGSLNIVRSVQQPGLDPRARDICVSAITKRKIV